MSWMKVKNKETYIPWVFTSGPQDQPFSPSIIQSCPTIAKILLWYKQNSSTLMSAEHLVGSMLSKTFKFVQLNARATSALLWNLNVMWLRPSIHARFLISLCCDLHWHVYAFFPLHRNRNWSKADRCFLLLHQARTGINRKAKENS